mgnify:CR=1 FL=1
MKNQDLLFKDLSARLPYGVRIADRKLRIANISYLSTKRIAYCYRDEYGEVHKTVWEHAIGKIKPIYRPLSDLTNTIQHNGEEFVPSMWISKYLKDVNGDHYMVALLGVMREENEEELKEMIDFMPLKIYRQLLSWHFNVNNLPEELWVNANDLEESPYK